MLLWRSRLDKLIKLIFILCIYYKGGHSGSCMRQLQREDGSITKDTNEMRDIATNFYKNLLTTPQLSIQ